MKERRPAVPPGDQMERLADISDDGFFRYALMRRWDRSLPICTFIMLNPSTADADRDDATIRRCIGFARREQCGTLMVVNCYPLRATDPKQLRGYLFQNPERERNGRYLHKMTDSPTRLVVCAWGDQFPVDRPYLREWLADTMKPLRCLGRTKSGNPRHPLRLAADTPLEVFEL